MSINQMPIVEQSTILCSKYVNKEEWAGVKNVFNTGWGNRIYTVDGVSILMPHPVLICDGPCTLKKSILIYFSTKLSIVALCNLCQ